MTKDLKKLELYRENYNRNNIPIKCDEVILEAKRVILNEHLEKIANFTLSTVHSRCKTNEETISRECKNYLDWKDDTFWKDLPNPKTKPAEANSFNCKINVDKDENLYLLISGLLQTSDSILPESLNSNHSTDNQDFHKKYFDLWRKAVKTKKERVEVIQKKKNQKEKLENFIKNLKKCKQNEMKKCCNKNKFGTTEHSNEMECNNMKLAEQMTYSKPCSNYKNRFSAQKNIIDMQKAKLQEQNKIIDELKLGIIREDLLKSIENNKIDIREIFSSCSEKTKCKVFVASVDEEPKLKINSHKAPKIVQKMEQRALERAQNREMILERKRLIEEKRQRILEEAIEKKRTLEDEEKKRNLATMKERRIKELEVEKVRQATKQRNMENFNKATRFHNKILIEQCFKKLYNNLQRSKEKYLLACQSYDKKLLRESFSCWTSTIESLYTVKYEIADAQFEYTILKSAMKTWQEYCLESTRNMQAAEDLYDFRLTSNTFINWHRYVCKQFILQVKHFKIAKKHYNRRILFHYFYQWKSLKAVNQLEKAKELKKRKWREKVWEILPDYVPAIDLYK